MSDLSRPLTPSEMRELKARAPLARTMLKTQQSFHVAASTAPQVRTHVEQLGSDSKHYRITVEVEGVEPGERAEPAPIPGTALRRNSPRIAVANREELLSAYAPSHLAVQPRPSQFVEPRRMVVQPQDANTRRPTTVFTPDERRIFRDTSYPWGCVGRVETPRGVGSGVMIGPRHLLTVSHIVDWNVPPPNAANWIKFTPAYYDGSEPFGHSYAIHTYWFDKENGDGQIDGTEEQYDYVAVVLDARLGDMTGWMGSKGYVDSWDGLNVWAHMGYPGDINNGQRPSYQSPFTLNGSDSEPDEHEAILHRADVFPGQSGGPIFAWWSGETGPRAVATQSWQNSSTNGASGGADLDELVVRARSEFP